MVKGRNSTTDELTSGAATILDWKVCNNDPNGTISFHHCDFHDVMKPTKQKDSNIAKW